MNPFRLKRERGRTTEMSQTQRERGQPSVLRVFQTRKQMRRFYDRISKVYDAMAEHSEAPVRLEGLQLLAARPGERVLEIGCGTGRCLAELARSVGSDGRVHGVDLSAGMLRRAKRAVEREGVSDRVVLQRGDAVQLPHPPSTMDAVFMSFTLELFDTPEIPAVLVECRRVLRPGGRLVCVGLSRLEPDNARVRVFEWAHVHFSSFVNCRPIYLRQSIEAAGFLIREARQVRMWVPVEIVLAVKGRS